MIAILIVAHAPLASALKAVAGHIELDGESTVEAIDVGPHAGPDDVALQLRATLDRLGRPEALVLVDIANATPSNGVRLLLADRSLRLRALSGVNVQMVWRAQASRKYSLDAARDRACEGAAASIDRLPAPPSEQSQAPVAHDDQHARPDQQ